MHDSEDRHCVARDLVQQEITLMCDQLPSAWDTARPPYFGMGKQAAGGQHELFVQLRRGSRVFRVDVVVDRSTIFYRLRGPDEFHKLDVSALRSDSARRWAK